MAVLFGFVMGWILSRTNVPGRAALEQLMALPYYVTPLMGALAWSLIGSPSGGFLNQVWRALGGEGHLIDVTTPYGIAWVMALFEGSVAFVMIGAVMKSMDPALEEASQVLGAGRLRTMLRITLPLVLPGLVSGWALAFINSFDEVTMTVFIAAPGTETLPVRMFLYIQDNIDPLVTSVSACVIAVTVAALIVLDRAYGLERLLVGRSADGH